MIYDLAELPVASLATLTSDVLADVTELRTIAREAADASRAPSTEKAYASDWRDFSAFATRNCRERMPAEPESVLLYSGGPPPKRTPAGDNRA